MSTGRIGSRAAVVGVGVLALMAAPSWAAKGGNGANAKLCQPGGYSGALFNLQGEAFKNEGACTKYGAKGGQIAGVNAVGERPIGGLFNANCSGFGLNARPGFQAECGARYEDSGHLREDYGGNRFPAADGTWSASSNFPCEEEVLAGKKVKVAFLVVNAFTAAEGIIEVHRQFPPPSIC